MPTQVECPDNPAQIASQKMCLTPLSKNLRGLLRPASNKPQQCETPPCKTLKTVHGLTLSVVRHAPCDPPDNKVFDGDFKIIKLVSAFDQDGHHRGFHAGDFVWAGQGNLRIKGRISGVTNVGTHRQPVFQNCQTCDTRGVMEGRLCGKITQGPKHLKGCQVFGAYRFKFDATQNTGGAGAIQGTFEGLVICRCG
jgi:hypothetical protein